MTQKIQAIEDNGGGLHVAILDDEGCWWLTSDWGYSLGGSMRREMAKLMADQDRLHTAALAETKRRYDELVDGGALVIATLEGDKFSHIDPERMGAAGRRWLGTKRYIAIDANSGMVWGDSADIGGHRFYGSGSDFAQALDRHVDPSAAASREYWDAPRREAAERGGYHIYDAPEGYVVPDVGDAGRAVGNDCLLVKSVCWSTREV